MKYDFCTPLNLKTCKTFFFLPNESYKKFMIASLDQMQQFWYMALLLGTSSQHDFECIILKFVYYTTHIHNVRKHAITISIKQRIAKLANGNPKCTHCSTCVKDANDGLLVWQLCKNHDEPIAHLLIDVYNYRAFTFVGAIDGYVASCSHSLSSTYVPSNVHVFHESNTHVSLSTMA